MPAIEETVFIAKSPEEVFDFLHHAENIPVWDSSIMQAEQLGADPIGVGTRLRGVSKVLGRRFEWTTEVIEFEPPTLSSSRAVEKPPFR